MTQFIKQSSRLMPIDIGLILISITLYWTSCKQEPATLGLELSEDTHISMIGGNLCSRMINYGHLETEIYLQHPDQRLVIRNMCDPGDTPGFRPHSG